MKKGIVDKSLPLIWCLYNMEYDTHVHIHINCYHGVTMGHMAMFGSCWTLDGGIANVGKARIAFWMKTAGTAVLTWGVHKTGIGIGVYSITFMHHLGLLHLFRNQLGHCLQSEHGWPLTVERGYFEMSWDMNSSALLVTIQYMVDVV